MRASSVWRMALRAAETWVAPTDEFARFGEVCRTFAPLYRQVTLTALRARMTGKAMAGVDPVLGYNDVKDAWNHYLQHDNHGRGVVLIGHSQGSLMLQMLIAREIETKPALARRMKLAIMPRCCAVTISRSPPTPAPR